MIPTHKESHETLKTTAPVATSEQRLRSRYWLIKSPCSRRADSLSHTKALSFLNNQCLPGDETLSVFLSHSSHSPHSPPLESWSILVTFNTCNLQRVIPNTSTNNLVLLHLLLLPDKVGKSNTPPNISALKQPATPALTARSWSERCANHVITW